MICLLDFGEHPIPSTLVEKPCEKERLYRARIDFCDACGFVQPDNPISLEQAYVKYPYVTGDHHQPQIPRELELIEKITKLEKNSRILEIGSNDGSFLEAIRNRGYPNVLGVDPLAEVSGLARTKGIETIPNDFNPETANRLVTKYGHFDLLVARDVIPYMPELDELQEAIRIVLRPGGFVLVEVPDFSFNLTYKDYTMPWYATSNCFNLSTLSKFLGDANTTVVHSETFRYTGMYLIVIGQFSPKTLPEFKQDYLPELREKVTTYQAAWPSFQQTLIRYLAKHQENGGGIAVYGAGHRVVSLINFANLGPYIQCALDDNPQKHGKYLPGSHVPILSGQALKTDSINLCLLAVNAENEESVISTHNSYQENGGCFASVLPPSDRLLPFWTKP